MSLLQNLSGQVGYLPTAATVKQTSLKLQKEKQRKRDSCQTTSHHCLNINWKDSQCEGNEERLQNYNDL